MKIDNAKKKKSKTVQTGMKSRLGVIKYFK